jgi:hypothetical protein
LSCLCRALHPGLPPPHRAPLRAHARSHTQVHLARACDGFLSMPGGSAEQVAAALTTARTDVFVDVAGHTRGARLLLPVLQPAVVTAAWAAGSPGTSGQPATQFFITDRGAVAVEGDVRGAGAPLPHAACAAALHQGASPPARDCSSSGSSCDRCNCSGGACAPLPAPRRRRGVNALYEEALVLLPVTANVVSLPPVMAPPPRDPGVRKRVVLGNFGTTVKLNPVVFSVWMAVLHRCPQCDLWLTAVRPLCPAAHARVCVRVVVVCDAVVGWVGG